MSIPRTAPSADDVLTVSQITFRIKDALEETFPQVWVCGEISNLARPQSGHVYLTLKDDKAQLRAAIWRSAAGNLRFDLQDGLQVLCRGAIDVYPPRGGYQLIIREMEPLGVGALELAFRQLHARLAAEGLFDSQLKRSLPRFPQRIAMVTSPTGAAVQDFLQVLHRRWPSAAVLVIGAKVQGDGAAEEIAAGIETANRLKTTPDVLVVGRGGGSLEDLWCFNEEIVVRAIFASRIPVISAVGHEIDVTLSDFAADVRALTPSEAAERVAPSKEQIATELQAYRSRLANSLRTRLDERRLRLSNLIERRVFRRPLDRLHETAERLDELDLRLRRATGRQLERAGDQLTAAAARLETLSPLAVLRRGYTITTQIPHDKPIDRGAALSLGDEIVTQFADARVHSRVESVELDR